jgi:hypothetical protein
MSETPKLYVHQDHHERLNCIYSEASLSELRAAARPLIDYEAAARAVWEQHGNIAYDDAETFARAAVDAALGLKENE